MQPLLTYKNQLCKHDHPCFINTFRQALVSLKYGVCIEILINLSKVLLALIRKKGLSVIKDILKPEYSKLEIPLFFCIFTLVLKGTYCLLRYFRKKQDKWNPFLSGAFGALLSMKFLNKRHWYLVLALIGARVVDCLHNVAVQKGYLSQDKKNFHIYLMFVIGNFFNAYSYFVQPDIIGNDIFRLWERMANLGWRQKAWIKSSYLSTQSKLIQQGAKFYDNVLQKRIDDLKMY